MWFVSISTLTLSVDGKLSAVLICAVTLRTLSYVKREHEFFLHTQPIVLVDATLPQPNGYLMSKFLDQK